jgi:hypothetical protein
MASTDEEEYGSDLHLELVGLSVAEVEPYDWISRSVSGGLIRWLSDRVDAPAECDRRSGAHRVIARINGLLLSRYSHGMGVADETACTPGMERVYKHSERLTPSHPRGCKSHTRSAVDKYVAEEPQFCGRIPVWENVVERPTPGID